MGMPKSTGLVHRVPCPWCGQLDDLADIEADLQEGSTVACPSCGDMYTVTAIRSVTQLWLEGVEGDA